MWCVLVCFHKSIYFTFVKERASSSSQGLRSQVSWVRCSSVPDSLCNEGHTLLCSAVTLWARVSQLGVVALVVVPVCCPVVSDQARWVQGSDFPVSGPAARPVFVWSRAHHTARGWLHGVGWPVALTSPHFSSAHCPSSIMQLCKCVTKLCPSLHRQ